MGSDQSNPFREGGQTMSEYTVTGKASQQCLTFLTHKKTQQEYLLRQLTFNQLREFTLAGEKLKGRKKFSNPHLTKLERVEQRTEDHMCSNFYKIYALWEYPSKTLAEEINERALQRKRFEEKQLRSILACSIMGLATLQQEDIRHESLTTRAILTDGEGSVKIADPLCLSLQANIESVYGNRNIKNIYLSPEQCESIQSQKPIINKNPYKNDVFTLGMIILECGLLDRQDQCYLDDCSRINWQKIQANLKRFGQFYDEGLKTLLQLMLKNDIRSRPDWNDLDKWVNKDNNTRKEPQKQHTGFITRTVQPQPARTSIAPPPISQELPQVSRFYGAPVGLSVIPSVSEKSSSYSQSLYNPSKPDLKFQPAPSSFFQTNYSGISSIPPNSIISPPPTTFQAYPEVQFRSNPPPPTSYSYQPQNFAQSHAITFQNNQNPLTFEFSKQPTILAQPSIQAPTPFYQQAIYQPQEEKTKLFVDNISPPVSSQFTATFGSKQNNYFSKDFFKVEPFSRLNVESQKNQKDNLGQFNLPFTPSYSQDNKYSIPTNFAPDYATKLSIDANTRSPQVSNKYIKPVQSVTYDGLKVQSPHTENRKIEASPFSGLQFQPKSLKTPEIDGNSGYGPSQDQESGKPVFVEEHFKLGSKYEGYKLNGLRHGHGKFFYQDGGSYEGEWRENKMNGKGVLYYQSNKIAYDGEWINDQFQGFGKLYNQNPVPFAGAYNYYDFDEIDQYWQYYEGNFVEDLKSGKGVLMFSNGERFEGHFEDDMVEGQGVFYSKDGKAIRGIWHENHLQQVIS